MRPIGLTNFVIWAVGSGFVSLIAGPSFAAWGGIVVPVAVLVAWRTRYWPEALGALAGFAVMCLVSGFLELSGSEGAAGATPFLAVGTVLAVSDLAMWRYAVARDFALPSPVESGASVSASSPGRLGLATLLGSIMLLVTSGLALLAFGFRCQSDTGRATPGSDLAGYCDKLSAHGELVFLVVCGPALIALVLGLMGARRRDGPMVLAAMLLGLAVAIAAHVPDWLLSNSV